MSNANSPSNEWYHGNPNLKRANVQIEYTPDQLEEYLKCASDPVYFIEKYVKIINVDQGLIPFIMYPFQKEMVRSFHENRFVICKLPRQSGKSTTVTSYMLWLILFRPDMNIAILANKGKLARDLLAKIQLAYEHIPRWMQVGIVSWNKGSIELENNSSVVAGSTSSDSIRGGSYNLVFLDEFAFVKNGMAEEFFTSVYPTISSGKTTKTFIVSTPKGMNHFYKRWIDAKEGRSLYKPIEINWYDIPGRDQKFKEDTIRNTSQEQWDQEFDCQFLGSTNTLISGSRLQALTYKHPITSMDGFDIYEGARKDRNYIMVVDSSEGVGLDYSAFIVIDTTEFPYKMVAKYRNNQIDHLTLPQIIYNAAVSYNDAFILLETASTGQQVADILHSDLEYENVLTTINSGRAGQVLTGGFGNQTTRLGVKTSKAVKAIGCANFKTLVEDEKLIIEDIDVITELANFVRIRDTYMAEDGYYDDLTMCFVLFGWMTRQPYFKELTDSDIRKKLLAERERKLEEEMLPFGLLDDPAEEANFEDEFDTPFTDMMDAEVSTWKVGNW